MWQPVVSDGVRASVHPAAGPAGPALRLDFDLGGTAGYAAARRALPVDLPANYEISFYLRADAPVNEFQVKLVDASGENVWWFHRPDFEFPHEWRLVKIKKRQIEFAWGPTADRALRRAAMVEFVVNAGRGGGSGSLYVSDLAKSRAFYRDFVGARCSSTKAAMLGNSMSGVASPLGSAVAPAPGRPLRRLIQQVLRPIDFAGATS